MIAAIEKLTHTNAPNNLVVEVRIGLGHVDRICGGSCTVSKHSEKIKVH